VMVVHVPSSLCRPHSPQGGWKRLVVRGWAFDEVLQGSDCEEWGARARVSGMLAGLGCGFWGRCTLLDQRQWDLRGIWGNSCLRGRPNG